MYTVINQVRQASFDDIPEVCNLIPLMSSRSATRVSPQKSDTFAAVSGGGGVLQRCWRKAGDGLGAEDVNSLNQVKTINNSNSKP